MLPANASHSPCAHQVAQKLLMIALQLWALCLGQVEEMDQLAVGCYTGHKDDAQMVLTKALFCLRAAVSGAC